MADEGLRKKQAEFEDQQLGTLDISVDQANTDKVLEAGKDVGMISDEIVEKINEDKDLKAALSTAFSKTFDKAKVAAMAAMEKDVKKTQTEKEKIAHAKAFREAFRMVYGRFMLEGPTFPYTENSELFAKLKGVLKFEIDEYGIKNRPELQAAIRRLVLHIQPRWKSVKAGKISKVKDEKKSTTKKKEAVEQYLNELGLDKLDESISEIISKYATIYPEFKEFHSLGIEIADLEAKLEMIDVFFAIQENVSSLNEEKNANLVVNQVLSLSDTALNLLFEKATKDQLFARKIIGITADQTLDKSDVKARLRMMRKIFHPDKFPNPDNSKKAELMFITVGAAASKLNEAIDNDNGNPIPDSNEYSHDLRDTVLKDLKSKKTKKTALGKKLVNLENFINKEFQGMLSSSLENLKFKIDALKNDDNINSNVKELCNVYLEYYKIFKAWLESEDPKNPVEISDFYIKIFKPFISGLSNFLASDIKIFEAKLNEIDSKIDRMERDIIPADIFDEVLAKAFNYVDPAVKQKAKRNVAEQVKSLEKAKSAQEYFSNGATLREFEIRHTQLSGKLDGKTIEVRGEVKTYSDLQLETTVIELEEEVKSLTDSRDRKDKDGNHRETADEREHMTNKITKKRQQISELNSLKTAAKALRETMKTFACHVSTLIELKIVSEPAGPNPIKEIIKSLESLDVEAPNFKCSSLEKIYKILDVYYTSCSSPHIAGQFDIVIPKLENAIKDAEKALKTMETNKQENLTDGEAAKKIITAMVVNQFPELSLAEQEKLAKLVLAGDVARLQTEEGYDALAKRGSAEDLSLENLQALAVRGKLIGFKYQEGDKEVQPFKGMKPENFKDWASIEKLFNLGQLNHKNGFFLMAALELFDEQKSQDPEVGVVRSVQSLRVEEKLKILLAKQLGVHERMHVAGVNKIINDAFKEQMEKVRPLVKAHFSTYDNEWDKGGKGVKSHEIQLLNLKYEELNDKLRKGEIDHAVYEIKLKALVKEATDADVIAEVGFSQNSMLSGFWHSKYSQWVRDRGHDAGKYVGKKALRFGWGSVKGGALGSLNAAGWLGLRGTSLGVGLAKWPTAILTGIGSGIFSIFRRGKWMDNVKKDVGKVMSTAGGWQDAMKGKAKGVKILSPIGKQISGEWGKSKYEGTKYADRVKKKEEKRAEKLKVLEEKAKLKAVEIASSPFIDLAQYKAKIEELDKILGTTTKFPAEGNVRVGHEEKPAANSDKKDDHGHQPPAAAAHH